MPLDKDSTGKKPAQRTKCIVFVYLPGETEAVPAGALTILQAGREVTSEFEYGNKYRVRRNAVALDPVELPLPDRDGVKLRPHNGNVLFGVFRDSAPDAWGRLGIKDRYLRRVSHPPELTPDVFDMTEVEYLLRSRPDRVGTLDFREKVDAPEPIKKISAVMHLKDLAREAHRINSGKPANLEVQTLLHPGTGMGGARPKTTIEDGGQLWLAKFPQESDRLSRTRLEHAMLNLAELCGISTIEHKLVPVEGIKDPVFMIRRFDRTPSAEHPGRYERQGYFSSLTTLGLDEACQQEGSYQGIAEVLQLRGHPAVQLQQRKELFRRMVLNAMVNNDDDHLRNHGMLRVQGLHLELAPAFDIEPRLLTPGVTTQRRLAIGVGRLGETPRDVTVDNMLSAVEPFGLTREEAEIHLADMACLVREHWRQCCEDAGMDAKQILMLEETMGYCESVLEELQVRCSRKEAPTDSATEPAKRPAAERAR
jgi:serine/threonine-protein kinase HipA